MEKEVLWQSDLENGTFKNPILYADYSDPDVIRVGDTYYMTASSFNYTPGLPILTSKDLVNWELSNYAIKNINYEQYKNPAHAKGVWAPSIRYHNETFWICYGMPDEGIFMTYAKDPLGTWSEPVLLLEGKGYIDSCPFWDEDGQAYIVHGYARSRIGFKSILGAFPISEDGLRAIGEDRFIYDGTVTQKTIEGPKVYKRDGYYYLFAPAGGVKQGWQTVLRSKNIYGPYEEKIVMHQGSSKTNGPHQGALVDTPNGDEWFIHFQDKGLYGRIAHLQPVQWKEGWPIIGINPDENGCGEPCDVYQKPNTGASSDITYLQASDSFETDILGLQWQWLGNHRDDFYTLDTTNKTLQLHSLNPSGVYPVSLWNTSSVLTQKFVCPEFESVIHLQYNTLEQNEQAGVCIMGGQYAYVAVRKSSDGCKLVYVESTGDGEQRVEAIKYEAAVPNDSQEVWVKIRLTIDDHGTSVIRMFYSFDRENDVDTGYDFTPSDHTWVGAKLGLFSVDLEEHEKVGFATFHSIKMTAL